MKQAIVEASKYFNDEAFNSYVDSYRKKLILKLNNQIFSRIVELKKYLRTKSQERKKINYKNAINILIIVIKNATLYRDELLQFTIRTTNLLKVVNLFFLLLLIFTNDETKQKKIIISII